MESPFPGFFVLLFFRSRFSARAFRLSPLFLLPREPFSFFPRFGPPPSRSPERIVGGTVDIVDLDVVVITAGTTGRLLVMNGERVVIVVVVAAAAAIIGLVGLLSVAVVV